MIKIILDIFFFPFKCISFSKKTPQPILPKVVFTVQEPEMMNTPPLYDVESVKEAILKDGNLLPESAEWIAVIINQALTEGWGVAKASLAIRKHGELLSTNEVKQLGLRGNTPVGKAYYQALTDQGRNNPKDAAFNLAETLLLSSLETQQNFNHKEVRKYIDNLNAWCDSPTLVNSQN